jgi:hypothetical protein
MAAQIEPSVHVFRPGRGQFQIFYKWRADQREYQPDFIAETKEAIYMLEPKMRKEMEDEEIVAKKDSAVHWCRGLLSTTPARMEANPGSIYSFPTTRLRRT